MLPHPFQHHRPQRLEEALELLSRYGDAATPYAGGTELLLAMKARVLRYDHLVDIKRIDALRGITDHAGEVVIGALSTHFTLANDRIVRQVLPAYAHLSENVANIRVRAQGTIGGNLCFAEPHADPPTLLCALDASLTLQGPAGERRVPMREFIEGEFTTVRGSDEILCDIRIPRPAADARFAYRSFGHLERPAVSIAVGYVPVGDKPAYRIFAGALTSAPTELAQLADRLAGVPPEELAASLASHATASISELHTEDDLLGSADYKRHLAGVLLQRACNDIVAAMPEGRK